MVAGTRERGGLAFRSVWNGTLTASPGCANSARAIRKAGSRCIVEHWAGASKLRRQWRRRGEGYPAGRRISSLRSTRRRCRCTRLVLVTGTASTGAMRPVSGGRRWRRVYINDCWRLPYMLRDVDMMNAAAVWEVGMSGAVATITPVVCVGQGPAPRVALRNSQGTSPARACSRRGTGTLTPTPDQLKKALFNALAESYN